MVMGMAFTVVVTPLGNVAMVTVVTMIAAIV